MSLVNKAKGHAGNAEQLKRYWAFGEGAAKWTTFTELRALLRKYVPERELDGLTANIYHLRYGRWPGAHH